MAIPALAGVSGSDKLPLDRASNVVTGTITAVGPGKAFSAYGPFNVLIWGSLLNALTTTAGSNSATLNTSTGVNVGDAINSVNAPPGTTVLTSPGAGAITMAFMPQTFAVAPLINSPVLRPLLNANGLLPNGKALSTLVGATIDAAPYFGTGVTVLAVGADGVSLQLSAAPTLATIPAREGQPPLIAFKVTGNCITVTGTDAAATLSSSAANYNAATTLQLERSADGGQTWVVCNVGGAGAIATFATQKAISLAFGDPEANMLYRINCVAFTAAANPVTLNYRISTTGQASTTLSVPAIS